MNWSETSFFALLQIMGVNLVMSGDNAVLVAMVVNRLPSTQRRPALFYGTAGAVLLHILVTLVVVRLLSVPLLLGGGGVLLFWIAWKLLQNEEESPLLRPTQSLASAVKTIICADFVMSVDNMLAVAGVGHQHPALIIFGLLFSVSLIMTGSVFISALMRRYPFFITIGAGVLAWTAGRMIVTDAVIQRVMKGHLGADWQNGIGSLILPLCLTFFVMTAATWRPLCGLSMYWPDRRREGIS